MLGWQLGEIVGGFSGRNFRAVFPENVRDAINLGGRFLENV